MVCVNDCDPLGITLRRVTGTVLCCPKPGPPLWFRTIAPAASPGELGVETVSVTCFD